MKANRGKARQEKDARKTENLWRKVRLLLFGLLGSARVTALLLLGLLPMPLAAADRAMLREYEAIRSSQ